MLVTVYDKRTGERVPHQVPQGWLDRGQFPFLSKSKPSAARVEKAQKESAPSGSASAADSGKKEG